MQRRSLPPVPPVGLRSEVDQVLDQAWIVQPDCAVDERATLIGCLVNVGPGFNQPGDDGLGLLACWVVQLGTGR